MYSIYSGSSIVWFQYEWVGPSHTWTGTCTMAMSLRWIGPMRHTRNRHTKVTYNSPWTHGKTEFLSQKTQLRAPLTESKVVLFMVPGNHIRRKQFASVYLHLIIKIPLQKAPDPSNRISTLRPKETIAPWFHVGRWCMCSTMAGLQKKHLMPSNMDFSAFGTVRQWSRVCWA